MSWWRLGGHFPINLWPLGDLLVTTLGSIGGYSEIQGRWLGDPSWPHLPFNLLLTAFKPLCFKLFCGYFETNLGGRLVAKWWPFGRWLHSDHFGIPWWSLCVYFVKYKHLSIQNKKHILQAIMIISRQFYNVQRIELSLSPIDHRSQIDW